MANGSWSKCGVCGSSAVSATLTIKDVKTYACVKCYEDQTGESFERPKPTTPRGPRQKPKRYCRVCGQAFSGDKRFRYCSVECSKTAKRSFGRTKQKNPNTC